MREKIHLIFEGQRQTILVALALFIVCFITYSNSLYNGFHIDDYGLILNNPEIRNIKNLFLNFVTNDNSGQKNIYYRPLFHITTMLNHIYFGNNPLGYHLVELGFFYIACLSIYWLLNVLFNNWQLSCLTSLFFCTHPINGALVNYVTMTAYSILIFAMNFSLICFLLNSKKGNKFYMVMSFLAFFLALLCHEMVAAFPLYLAAVLIIARKYDIKQTCKACFPYIVFIVFYLIFRFKFASLKSSLIDKISMFDLSVFSYVASFTKLMIWYFSKLIFLNGIVVHWATPMVRENLMWWNLLLDMVLGGCFYLIFKVWGRNVKSLALSWILIGFIPVMMGCLLEPQIGFMIEPHWLLFSSMGYFLFLASILVDAGKKLNRKLTWIVTACLLVVFVLNARQYNYLWGNEKRYCQYWLKVVPGFKDVMFHLASAYMEDGEFAQARELFQQTLNNEFNDYQVYINLGLMDSSEGDYRSAVDYFQRALKIYPASAITYSNLGDIYWKMNELVRAENYFQQALKFNRFLIEPRLGLGDIYKSQGKLKEAIVLLEENLQVDPKDERSLYGLVQLYWADGQRENAFALGKKMLEVSQDPQMLTNLGSMFAQEKFMNLGLAMYMTALRWDPKYKEAFLEMGKLYGNLNKFNQAIVIWEEGLKWHPEEKMFKELILQAMELKKKGIP